MERIKELDALRGIAAVGIVLLHANPTYTFWMWSFVDLFFVLSGYLITRMLVTDEARGFVAYRNFWIRRALRIWPVYYLTLVGVVLALTLKPHGEFTDPQWTGIWESVVFMQFTEGYFSPTADAYGFHPAPTYPPAFGHSWSVAVEEQFYVLWPLVLLLFSRRFMVFFTLCATLLVLGFRLRSDGYAVALLLPRMDGLLLGAMLAVGQWRYPCWFSRKTPESSWMAALLAMVALGAVGLLFPYLRDGYVMGHLSDAVRSHHVSYLVTAFAVLYVAVVGWVIIYGGGREVRWLRSRSLVYLGSISYAIYMFHIPIQWFIGELIWCCDASPRWVTTLGMWIMTIGLAHLSKVWLEDRINGLKRHFPIAQTKRGGGVNPDGAVSFREKGLPESA